MGSWRLPAAVAAVLWLLSSPAAAADTEGWYVGVGLNASVVGANDPPDNAPSLSPFVKEEGGGLALTGAYGFTPGFAVRVVLNAAEHETTDPEVTVLFSGVTLEGAWYFNAGGALRPYLFGGVGGYELKSRRAGFRYRTTGPGTTLGLGALWFLGEHFALEAAVRADLIRWQESSAETDLADGGTVRVSAPLDEQGSAAKLLLGAGWWF